MPIDNSSLYTDVQAVINKHSAENKSNTPDYILAEYLMDCLTAFEHAVKHRDKWHGFIPEH